MTKSTLFATLSLLGGLCLTHLPTLAQGSAAPQGVDDIVALVNSEPITRNEVLARHKRLPAQSLRRALEQLIDERAVQQLAREDAVRIQDPQLDEAMLNIARDQQLTGLAQMRAKYESEGGNWQSLREEMRAELARAQVREREVDARVRVTQVDIDRALQERSMGSQQGPQEINLAHILVALPDSPTAEDLARARSRAQRIVQEASAAGADFLKLATQVSDAADKANGGVMGLRLTERYPALFIEATEHLKSGEVSGIVQSDAGFHVLKVLERQAASTVRVVHSRVRHILLPITAQRNEAQTRAQMQAYKNQIESGRMSFAAAAREYSADGSAAQGGDLGWASPGLFVPEFERVMNALPIGKLSTPFVSRFGVHLLEVVDRKEVALTAPEQRELLRQQLRDKKIAEAYALWLAEVRGRSFIEYRDELR